MTRPCANCGGNGKVPHDTAFCKWRSVKGYRQRLDGSTGDCPFLDGLPCFDCARMPWLPRRYADIWVHYHGTDTAPEWWWDDKPFKPDRSTVMRWCRIHNSSAESYGKCEHTLIFSAVRVKDDCEIVWIERPTPLEETDD